MTPFDFLNSINSNKKDLFEDPQAKKDYIPFIVNKSLSYFQDTVFYANEMNQHHTLDKNMQFNFLRHAVPARKRYKKWVKHEAVSEDIELVSKMYNMSQKRAVDALELLSAEQIQMIREFLYMGGTEKHK